MADDLNLVCTMTHALGTLDLEGGAYELERASFEEVSVSWRKQEVSNAWVEGSYVVGAVRENITRPLNVWVTHATANGLKAAVKTLTDALEQLQFTLTFGVVGTTSTWRCQMADYAVRQEQGFMVAKTALVKAQVPTLPTPIA